MEERLRFISQDVISVVYNAFLRKGAPLRQQKHEKRLPNFATFNAVYCSGFFVDNGTLVTTMCLLFDRAWLLNHLDLVTDFSKKFRFHQQVDLPFDGMKIEPVSPNATDSDPLASLTLVQRETAMRYLYVANQFCMRYRGLLREHVLCTDLYPDGEVFNVELIEKGLPGRKNKYQVSEKSMRVISGEGIVEELDTLVSRGAVPLLSGRIGKLSLSTPRLSPKYLSSLLAMKAVELALPQMKHAHADTILEAREKLRDFLPPFWATMFRLSTDFRGRIEQGQSLHDIERECDDFIDTTIRPTLIELNNKLEKDRKSWFHKILSTTAKETKLMIAKPPLTMAGLVSSGLQLGANITLDVAQGESASNEAGLTYLIELDKLTRK